MYEPRFYREWVNERFVTFTVTHRETDLMIRAPIALPEVCFEAVRGLRARLDDYIGENPGFRDSLEPTAVPDGAPEEVRELARAGARAGVGPMAGVAGLFAERAGRALLEETDEVIVENGGDIFLAVREEVVIGIFAGRHSPFSCRIGIKIASSGAPLGVCTSAGTVGPSLSEGNADAVVITSPSTVIADAVATAVGNRVRGRADIDSVTGWARRLGDVTGVVVIKDDRIGAWGDFELVKTGE